MGQNENDGSQPNAPFAVPCVNEKSNFTDNRGLCEWESKYPQEARSKITFEAWVLVIALVISIIFSGIFLSMADQSVCIPIKSLYNMDDHGVVININFRLFMMFFVGTLGGVTFSIKWLIHSAAKCKWHLDRRYWRFFVPLIGGVYACVVLTLLDGGIIGDHMARAHQPVPLVAAFAFLVGYFSDGVSGLLSNIANAVFGTLDKK